MKRCLTVVLAASMLVAFVEVAQAAHGMPSHAMLRAMGLTGMQVMSDRDAMNVRGMGYYSSRKHSTAIAFGVSYAKVGGHGAGAGSIDGFFSKGKHFAAGVHGSIAGKVWISFGGGHGSPPMSPPHNDFTNGNGGPPHGPPHNPPPSPPHGGNVKVKAIVVFAGGFAVAKAH